MLLRIPQSPRTAVRIGMALVVVGLSLNPILMVATRNVQLFHLGPDAMDFWRGFMVGLGIVLEICGIVVMLPAARYKGHGGRPSHPGGA